MAKLVVIGHVAPIFFRFKAYISVGHVPVYDIGTHGFMQSLLFYHIVTGVRVSVYPCQCARVCFIGCRWWAVFTLQIGFVGLS
jgi:hypothetical protein